MPRSAFLPGELPPNLPTYTLDDVGEPYWCRPSFGEVVRTHWECLRLTPRVEWKLTAYFTADDLVHDGRAHYRVPCSLRAWLKVARQLPRKLWRHYVKGEI